MSSKNKKNRSTFGIPVAPVPVVPFSSKALAWISLVWAIWALYTYWVHYPWITQPVRMLPMTSAPVQWNVFWLDAKALLLMVTSLAGSTAVGSSLLRPWRLTWYSALEELVFSMGLGLASVGYLVFG